MPDPEDEDYKPTSEELHDANSEHYHGDEEEHFNQGDFI